LGYSGEQEEEELYEQEVDAGIRLPSPAAAAKPVDAVVERAPPVYDPEWVER